MLAVKADGTEENPALLCSRANGGWMMPDSALGVATPDLRGSRLRSGVLPLLAGMRPPSHSELVSGISGTSCRGTSTPARSAPSTNSQTQLASAEPFASTTRRFAQLVPESWRVQKHTAGRRADRVPGDVTDHENSGTSWRTARERPERRDLIHQLIWATFHRGRRQRQRSAVLPGAGKARAAATA